MSPRLPMILVTGVALVVGFAAGRLTRPDARPVPQPSRQMPRQQPAPAPVPAEALESEVDGGDLVIRSDSPTGGFLLFQEGAGRPLEELSKVVTAPSAGRGWTVRLPLSEIGHLKVAVAATVLDCPPGGPCKPCEPGVCGPVEPPPETSGGFFAPWRYCKTCDEEGCIKPLECWRRTVEE